MINLLVRNPPIILQHIIILRPRRLHNLLNNRQNLSKLIIRDICQLLPMVLWNDQGVPAGERLDVQEGKDGGGLVELEGRDVAWEGASEEV